MYLAASLLALHVMTMAAAPAGDAAPSTARTAAGAGAAAAEDAVVADIAQTQTQTLAKAPERWAATPAHQPVWLSGAAVKLAVREASASAPLPASSRRGLAYGADSQYRQFDLAFAYARRPDCLHPDGLKFQPAALGQVELDSEFAIPFWIAAIAKGKCNFGE